MEEHDKKDAGKRPEEAYESPKLVCVSLRPEEAVLGHCKVTGSTGPVGGGCHPVSGFCRVPGS
jgi:hypothetical protein